MTEAHDVLSRVFASDLSITQKPRVSSDPLRKDRHSHPHTFSVIVWNFDACGKVSSFVPRDPAIIIAEPLLIPNFLPEVVGFCSGNSSRFNFGSQGSTFFFSIRYLCQSSDNSFHTWSSKSDRSSSCCCCLAFVGVRVQAPCGAFISFPETHSATKDSLLSICGLSPGL